VEALQLTLTNRLRLAALARAEHGGRVVGTYVIDDEGVIDLRALEDRGPNTRASDLAPLTEIAGRFGDAGDVTSLYVVDPVPTRKLFRRRTKGPSTVLPAVLAPGDVRAVAAGSRTRPDGSESNDAAPRADTATAGGAQLDPDTDPVAGVDDNVVIDLTELWSTPPTAAPQPVVDLRPDSGPSSLQSAIAEFNKLNPFADAPERDIESGIRFGHGTAEPAVERPPLFGSWERSELASTPPEAVVSDLTETPDTSGADTSGGDTSDGGQSDGGNPPVVCPVCGGAANRDFANRFLEIDFYSCGECFHMWHLTADDTNG
jgi:hypothetical protein